MYRALYRKWRPLIFADVAGQDAVTQTLRAQVASGRLSHAYLFTGTRGTGKTTCAKILSRAANCEQPAHGDPCNECPACKGLLDGSLLDVIEIDAASHNGVDSIRELREESVYAPVSLRRRVYIIDEVHMLSTSAFNALLKTLEEPPAHVLFILATTEVTKVPATILSRCQRFVFKRIGQEDIVRRLLYVARQEGITVTEAAAGVLARMSDGAMRDALSLLDQCAAVCGQTIDEKDVFALLGLVELSRIEAWAQAMARRDEEETLSVFRALYAEGREPAGLLEALYRFLHDCLADAILRGDPGDLVTAFGKERLLACLTILQETDVRIARSATPKIDAELCLLRLSRTGLAHAVEEYREALPVRKSIEKKASPSAPNREGFAKADEEQTAHSIEKKVYPSAPNRESFVKADEERTAQGALNEAKSSESDDAWPSLRDAIVKNLPPSVAPFLRRADGKAENGTLTIFVDTALAADRLDQPEARAQMEAETERVLGKVCPVIITIRAPKTDAPLNPRLQALMDRAGEVGHRERE